MTLKVLDPTPEADAVATPSAPPLPDLAGARVGLLDNGKIRVDRFCDFAEDILRTEYGVAEVVRRRKRNASAPAGGGVLADLLDCDGVISAVGD